jgi:hypothetical protein
MSNVQEAYASLPSNLQPHFLKVYSSVKSKLSTTLQTVESFPYVVEFFDRKPLGLLLQRMLVPFDLHMITEVKPGALASMTQCGAGFAMQSKDLVLGVNEYSIEQFKTEPPKNRDDGSNVHEAFLDLLKKRPLRLFLIRLVVMQADIPYENQHQQEQLPMMRHHNPFDDGPSFHGHGWLQKLSTDLKDDGDDNNDEVGMAEDEVSFKSYSPLKLKIGVAHPDPVSEATSLSSQDPPDINYQLKLPKAMINRGCLSGLQLESVAYACQRHQTFLPDGEHRAGFFIGDGAGVGKGRQVSGLILENSLHKRTKAVWVSISTDLYFDAQRDLRDIGAKHIEVSFATTHACRVRTLIQTTVPFTAGDPPAQTDVRPS